MKRKLPQNFAIQKMHFLLLFLIFSMSSVFGQSVGDYRSVASGIWTSLTSWEYYNGSGWVTPSGTSPQGYPGQFTGTGAVTIQSGHTISIGTGGISTQSMGTLTISGSLVLTGVNTGGAGTDYYFNTSTVIVTPLLGTITFIDKVNLRLPANAILQVTEDTTPNPDYYGLIGDCNHNQDIYIGTSAYAYCNGGGSTGLTFDQVMNGGGSLNAVATSNSPVCQGNTIILAGSYTGAFGSSVTYAWLIIDPNNSTTTSNTQNPTITNAIVGTYTITLTCSTMLSGNSYSNSETISVIVNGQPTVATLVGGASTVCVGSTTPAFTDATAGGVWSITNGTGTATVSNGVVTGVAAGTVTVAYTVTSGGCSNATTQSLTVNPNLPASVSIGASPAGAICSGTSMTFTATSTNGGTTPSYQWKLNGANVGTNSTTYTNAGLANGDVVSCILTSNASPCLTGSPATSNLVTMTVNPQPVAPTLNNITLVCNQTRATQIWTAISNISSYRFDISTDSSFGTYLSGYQNLLVDGSATSLDVSGLDSAITYHVRARSVSSTCGISPNSPGITISLPITKTTDGVTWDNGAPDNKRAVFAGNATITSQVNACSCQINSGVNVVFGVPGGTNANAVLKLENGLNVLGTGTLTFENNASLIQVNDAAVNSGKIIYKRISAPMKNFDYTYWSSPVVGQTAKLLSPNTLPDKYFRYVIENWVFDDGIMNPGVGFIIRTPKPGVYGAPDPETVIMPYAQPVQFVGVPNNGVVSIQSQGVGMSNLIGNPYPSALDADAFITGNSNLIGGALYFWTHNTAIAQSGSFYVYDSNDYAMYTLAGGVKATTGGEVPNGKIAGGLSFFVQSSSTSSSTDKFIFSNSMRNTAKVLASGSNSQFFRMAQTSKMATIEKNRVWLNLTNSEGAFKQLLVGYIAGATNEIDNLYDGISLGGNTYVDFYSINNGENLAIQGRALPFDESDQIPLGYKAAIDGDFTISIVNTDGVLTNQSIFIEDKLKGIVANLKNGSYTFSSAKGTFNDRFVLRFVAVNTSKIASKTAFAPMDNSVLVSVKDKQIKVNSFDQIIDKVLVYDLKASLLYQKHDVSSNECVISNFASIEQFLIVQVLLKNGKWITKEIVFR